MLCSVVLSLAGAMPINRGLWAPIRRRLCGMCARPVNLPQDPTQACFTFQLLCAVFVGLEFAGVRQRGQLGHCVLAVVGGADTGLVGSEIGGTVLCS